MITKTFEQLLKDLPGEDKINDGNQKVVINLMKQVRKATLQECAKKAFAESSRSNITSKDKSNGKLGLTCIHLGEVSVNRNSILSLNLNSIEIDD